MHQRAKKKLVVPALMIAGIGGIMTLIGMPSSDSNKEGSPPVAERVMPQSKRHMVSWDNCVRLPRDENALQDEITITAYSPDKPSLCYAARYGSGGYVWHLTHTGPLLIVAISGEKFLVDPKKENFLPENGVGRHTFRFYATGADPANITITVRSKKLLNGENK